MKWSAGEEWGAQFRSWRSGAGHTQGWIARRVGTEQPNIARMEAGGRGRQEGPTVDFLLRLCRTFRITVVIDGGGIRIIHHPGED